MITDDGDDGARANPFVVGVVRVIKEECAAGWVVSCESGTSGG